jgi:hypothetical protein
MIGMERNQQAETDEERSVTIYRILKCRHFGGATGKTFSIEFNQTTGRLQEASLDSGFFDDSLF